MKKLFSQFNTYLPIIGIIAIAIAFIVFTYASSKSQDVRQKAAVVRGKAKLIASPEHETTFNKNAMLEMNITLSLQNIEIDGFQVIAKIKGNKSSDLTFIPAQSIDGLRVMMSKLSSPTDTTDSELQLSYITERPDIPYKKEGLMSLGTLRMTAPGEGKMDVIFDKTSSKVTVHGTAEDILEIDRDHFTYTFLTPPPPVQCEHIIPTVLLTPTTQSAVAGKPLKYEISVTNNQVGAGCSKEIYDIVPTVPTDWQTTNPQDIELEPGKTGKRQFTVTSPVGSAAQEYQVSVKARSITSPGQQGEAKATFVVLTKKPLSLIFKVKLQGVTDGKADGFKANIRFAKGSLDSAMDLIFRHVGDGLYQALATITDPPAAGPGYQIIVKGQKHASRKFCKISGQTTPCRSFDSLSLPEGSDTATTMDFTGLRLDPGDLPPQDGKVDRADIQILRNLMKKPCGDLSADDKMTGDLNYDGCIDTSDAILLRRTLETRYDEN